MYAQAYDAGVPPKVTDEEPATVVKFLPVIDTETAPLVGPEVRDMLVTIGRFLAVRITVCLCANSGGSRHGHVNGPIGLVVGDRVQITYPAQPVKLRLS